MDCGLAVLLIETGAFARAGLTWQWPKGGGTADGLNMTECSLAALPNNTVVLNARDYMGQLAHTVHRATMWSSDEGASTQR